MFCIVKCCLWCLEKFIRFMNKNAYIQIAINGTSFCTACKDAFLLLLSNAGRTIILAGIGAIFVFIGKMFITVLSTIIAYILLTKIKSL